MGKALLLDDRPLMCNMSYMTKTKLTSKKRELLMQAELQEPMTIYALASMLGRPYRRVHDHVQQLAVMGLLTLKQQKINNRNATLVISNDIYYQRLLRLDDMYAAHLELSA